MSGAEKPVLPPLEHLPGEDAPRPEIKGIDAIRGPLQQLLDLVGACEERAPHLGRDKSRLATIENRRACAFLQQLQLRSDGGRSDAQLARRRGNAPATHSGRESPELLESEPPEVSH